MTVTFILTMVVGIARTVEGRDPLPDGFGMIAVVSLPPILAVLTLDLLYGREEKKNEDDIKAEA